MQQYVKVEFEDGVGKLTLNRPDKRNALKRVFIDQLNDGIKQLKGEPSLRVLVLQAEGPVFCAGMDLGEMQERAQSVDANDQWQKDSEVYCQLLTEIYSLPVPTVAVLTGPALAGGMGLVLACDIVIGTGETYFALPEPMRGITAAMVTPLLIHRVGPGHATFMLLSGKRITAERAFEMGMCHLLTAVEEIQSCVGELIESILTGSPAALAITKRHIDRCAGSRIAEDINISVSVSAEARETDDAREGLTAFLEKRKPNWASKTR